MSHFLCHQSVFCQSSLENKRSWCLFNFLRDFCWRLLPSGHVLSRGHWALNRLQLLTHRRADALRDQHDGLVIASPEVGRVELITAENTVVRDVAESLALIHPREDALGVTDHRPRLSPWIWIWIW
jgi:hypothetical protein